MTIVEGGGYLWVWLVRVVVRRYIDFLIILLIPTPLVLALFCSSIPTSLFIFKCFLFLFMLFLCNIANVAQRTFEIVQKSRSHEHGNIIICLLIALIDQISFLSL